MRHLHLRRIAAVAALGGLLTVGDALAVVGRPLTPVSYAGVARRTTRRAVYGTAAVAGSAAYTAAAMTALPYGCAVGVPCGGTIYRPVYQGTTVVYVPQ